MLGSEGRVSRSSGISLTLESRILASAGARLVVQMLLGEELDLGATSVPKYMQLTGSKISRHSGLRVVHLGPHLLPHGAEEELLAAAAAELQQGPQVVVIDEAGAEGAEGAVAWPRVFEKLLVEARSFSGAVVVSLSESASASALDSASARFCSERWLCDAGWLLQEPLAELQISENALCSDEEVAHLSSVSELSKKVFDEDSVTKAREKGWSLTLLLTEERLCGFMCHMQTGTERHIARLAVVEESRGQGYGKRLMHWLLQRAAMSTECRWISLSSLDSAMQFYEQFGFTDMTSDDHTADGHFQTWMELQNLPCVSGQDMPDHA